MRKRNEIKSNKKKDSLNSQKISLPLKKVIENKNNITQFPIKNTIKI
jgi:hypothetical protein